MVINVTNQCVAGLVFTMVLVLGCSENGHVEDRSHIRSLKVWDSILTKYNIKDTISALYISHNECTECLDAYVDSGTVYIPEYVAEDILKARREKRHLPEPRDLYITGYSNIVNYLFFSEENFGKSYKVTGKIVGFRGIGFIFSIDQYEEIRSTDQIGK
jgi:hypothetical protein